MDVDRILYILIGCNAGLLGMFVWHLFKCRDTRIDIATIRQSIARIEHEIGDHDSGIRGTQHAHAQRLTEHEMRIAVVERP